MSIYVDVYWKEEIKDVKDFEVCHRRSKDGQEWDEFKIHGWFVSTDKGVLKSSFQSPTSKMPEWAKDMCSGFSIHEWIPHIPTRKTGIYRYRGAEARVENDTLNGEKVYNVIIKTTLLDDGDQLYRLLRSGKIFPAESWEEKQMTVTVSILHHLRCIKKLIRRILSIKVQNWKLKYKTGSSGLSRNDKE